MARWWEVRWRRVGLALLIVFGTPVVLWGGWILVQWQIGPWRVARALATNGPGMELLPSPLPDRSLAVMGGERVERFGFSIQLPWQDQGYDRTLQDIALFSFKTSGTITLHDPLSRMSFDSAMRLEAKAVPELNGESFQSNYGLASAAIGVRPEDVKWWKLPGQNEKDLILLMMRSLMQVDCQGPPFRIAFGEVRGVQFGNPAVAPYCVQLALYDSADRHYAITINSGAHGPVITQAEVNAMVASLRPIGGR